MTDDPDLQVNKRLAETFLAVFSSGQVETIGALLHDDASWWVSGTVPGISGTYTKTQMLDLLSQVTTIYKQGALQITPSSMLAEGNQVAVEAESYAELHDGRIYNNFYHFVFEVRDGSIIRVKEYLDTQHMQDIFGAG